MRRIPGPREWDRTRRQQSPVRTVRAFLMFALACIGTWVMAMRAVHWLGGPVWLGLLFAVVALALAGYYLARMFPDSRVVRSLLSRLLR